MTINRLDNRLIAFFDILGFSTQLEEIGVDAMNKVYNGQFYTQEE